MARNVAINDRCHQWLGAGGNAEHGIGGDTTRVLWPQHAQVDSGGRVLPAGTGQDLGTDDRSLFNGIREDRFNRRRLSRRVADAERQKDAQGKNRVGGASFAVTGIHQNVHCGGCRCVRGCRFRQDS